MSCAVVAYGAISALGEGEASLGVGAVGELAPSAITRDPELVAAALHRPFCARAKTSTIGADRDSATVLIERALAACAAELDRVLPGWRGKRVGLALGTSSGGMRAFSRRFANDAASPIGSVDATYLGPLLGAARPCDLEPVAFVLGACASGTLAIGLAREWIRAGRCDVALCGGFDAVSVFVASGFEALRATCTEPGPRPFRTGRDGLALGEGAAVLALVGHEMAEAVGAPVLGYVSGFGASCDAVHLTAPDREGRGLARAAQQALAQAGEPRVDLVSAHGTSTQFNDASEAAAIATVLGDRSREVPLTALKGGIGHTLGAAGALESLSALAAMRASIAPASVGSGPIEGAVRILDRAERHAATTTLKLSAAFGGANGALVLTKGPVPNGKPPAVRTVYVSRGVAVVDDIDAQTAPARLASITGYAEDKIARGDLLVRITMASVAKLRDAVGPIENAGIIVGVGLATLDTNASYLARIEAAGAVRAEPRRFPFTTPNAAAGECAVAFGLTGPAFAVGGGPHGGIEALGVAAELVRSGVADRIVVVAVDEGGPESRRLAPETNPGGVAVLVTAAPEYDRSKRGGVARGEWARLEGWRVGLPKDIPQEGALVLPAAVEAHRALLPLADGVEEAVDITMPWGGFANARFFWL